MDGSGDVGCIAAGALGMKGGAALGAWFAGWGAIPGGVLGAAGGCVLGGWAASETAEAIWEGIFEDDTSPLSVLNGLKENGLDQVPDEVSAGMSPDMIELVAYKQKVSSAVDQLNEVAEALSEDPENETLQENFIVAGKAFKEIADAYNISVSSMDPDVLTQYTESIEVAANAPEAGHPYVMRPDEAQVSNLSTVAP